MVKKLTAIVFIRSDSQRLPRKNFLDFNGSPLFHRVLNTLSGSDVIHRIIVNSDSDEVREFAAQLPKAVFHARRNELLAAETSANAFIDDALKQNDDEFFFQTHVTSPLLRTETIAAAAHDFFAHDTTNTSLVAVTPVQARMFRPGGIPLNHQLQQALQQTQDIEPVLFDNSCFYIFSRHTFYHAGKNRYGLKRRFFNLSAIEAIDIDHAEDFALAALVDRNRNIFPELFSGQSHSE